jgi:diadenosine tetraphosphate (Ap4A) HIT family hydrolase
LSANASGCVFCDSAGGDVVWSSALARVVRVGDEDHPAFCRVIAQRHVREMTDLEDTDRAELMRIVYAVERAQRKLLRPEKINLASFGNMVPHVHWHVIPRFSHDPHFPNPVWGSRSSGAPVPLPADFWSRFSRELRAQLES